MRRNTLCAALCLAWLATGAHAAEPATPASAQTAASSVSVPTPDADDEAAQLKALEAAWSLIQDKRAAEALPALDAVIAHYEARFPAGKMRWYVARDLSETLLYLGMASLSAPTAGSGPADAQVLKVQWANAWYLKGFALVELERAAEARAALGKAIELSPNNATYLIELAETYKLAKDWDNALDLFTQAVGAAEVSPDEVRKSDLGHAMRGQAFVHVERGNYAEARKILEKCLKLDPNDARAKEELEYIAKLERQK
jgi:tetratricopeptide (TPR) repeat protein